MANHTKPEQMKAQVLESYNQPYVFKELPLPTISDPNDLLIRVNAAGYCHTDAVLAAGQMRPNPPEFPHVGCHEFAGTVIERAGRPSSLAETYPIGTRIGVPGRGFHACGQCFECQDPENDYIGFSNYCTNVSSNGLSRHGGFGEYAVVDARQVVALPDGMEAVDAAPLMCAGVTIYNALQRCALSPGQRLGVIGCGGGLGHLGLQFADAMGLKTTGVDAAVGPLRLAKSLGTSAQIVDAREISANEVVQQIGKEDGKRDRPDMGLDAVVILPESQASFDYGVTLLRNHGLCMVVSFPEKGFQISARDLVFRDITVKGALLGTNSILQETVEFAAKHNIRPIKQTFGLAQLNDLVDEYNQGKGGKLVVDMSM